MRVLVFRSRRKLSREGFTLVELLVVVVILAVLAAIAIPIFMNQKHKAQLAATVSMVSTLGSALSVGQSSGGTVEVSASRLTVIDGAGATTYVPLTDVSAGDVTVKGLVGAGIVAGTSLVSVEWCVSTVNSENDRVSMKNGNTAPTVGGVSCEENTPQNSVNNGDPNNTGGGGGGNPPVGNPPSNDIIFIDDPNDPSTVPGEQVGGTPDWQTINLAPGAVNVVIPAVWNGEGTQPDCSITNLPSGYSYDPATCVITGPATVTGMLAQIIVAGPTHSCAASGTGDVTCWGDNSAGALGSGTASAVCYDQSGYPNCGTNTPNGVTLPVTTVTESGLALTGATHLAAGLNFTCARTQAGALWCWGATPYGTYARAHQVRANGVTKVVTGEHSVWVLNSNGTVDYQTGTGSGTVQLPVGQAGQVSDIAYGSGFLMTVNAANTSYLRDVASPSSAPTQTIAPGVVRPNIMRGGGDGANICYVLTANTDRVYCLGTHARYLSGTIGGYAAATSPRYTTFTGRSIVSLAPSAATTCAVLDNGSMSCWGGGDEWGQRGDGAGNEFRASSQANVTTVYGVSNFVSASAGSMSLDPSYGGSAYGHVCGILTDGTVRCWGGYSFGEIGDGTVPRAINSAGNTYPDYRSNPATIPVPMTDMPGLPRSLTVSWTGVSGIVTKNVTIQSRPTAVGLVPGFTLPLKPASYAGPTVTASTTIFGQMDISWEAPQSIMVPTTYMLQYSLNQTNWTSGSSFTTPNSSSWRIVSATGYAGTPVYVRVLITFSDGTTMYSNVTSSTFQTAPTTPTITSVSPTPATAASVTVSWVPPAGSSNVLPVTGYTFEVSIQGGSGWAAASTRGGTCSGTVSADARTCTIAGISTGWIADVRMKATNAAGTSVASTVMSGPSAAAPSAPTITSVVPTPATASSVTVSWTPPSNDGGLSITGYTFEVSIRGGSGWYAASTRGGTCSNTVSAAARTCTIAGISTGWIADVRMKATTAAGTSAASTVASGTSAAAPSAPTITSVVATPTSYVTVSWVPPTDDGGPPITGYTFEVSIRGGSGWYAASTRGGTCSGTVSAAVRACTISVSTGWIADVRMKAISASGTSVASTIVSN